MGSILGPSHGGACVVAAAAAVVIVVAVVVALLPLLARPGSADIPYRFMYTFMFTYMFKDIPVICKEHTSILHVEMMNKCRMYWKYQAIGDLHTSRLHL